MDSSGGGDDSRWKLSNSKKGRSRSGRPHSMAMPMADAGSSTSMLSRSYSAASVMMSSRATAAAAASTTTTSSSYAATATSSSSSQQQQQQQQQQGGGRLSKKKCVEAVKEQRARFYIVRRCVSMLVCWRDY